MYIIVAHSSLKYTVQSFPHQNVGATCTGLRCVDEGILTSHTSKNTKHQYLMHRQGKKYKVHTENREKE